MELTIKAPATVPAGTYPATFQGVEEKTSARDQSAYLRWSFTVAEGDVSGTSSTNTGPMSKAHKWLKGVTGRSPKPDETFDTDALIGRPCMVVLETNDNGFSNVVDVLPSATSPTDELGF